MFVKFNTIENSQAILEKKKSMSQEDQLMARNLKAMSQDRPYQYEGFSYEGDRLASFRSKDIEYRFVYENERVAKSDYFKGGKRYSQRFYHYLDNGLLEKIEIYNVLNEPEYTITYDYEYFESW